ncbi:MAG: AAA family ATPase [Oceanospirillaceae bacterium]|nr:AAA family ATPase [Oceanospirillaceae bacterium]
MDSFSVRNFKSLRNIEDVPIKPINLFVGKNSSGKSSLLRLWPLLKQSVMRRTKGPLLFYGEEVDFGSFDDVLCNKSKSGSIELSFGFSIKDISNSSSRFLIPPLFLSGYSDVKIRITIIKIGDAGAQVSKIEIFTHEDLCSIEIDQNGKVNLLKINESTVELGNYEYRVVDYSGIIPKIVGTKPHRAPRFRRATKFGKAEDIITETLAKKMHANTSTNTITEGIDRLIFGSIESISKQLTRIFTGKHFGKVMTNEGYTIASDIRGLIFARDAFILIETASDYIRGVAHNTKYIKPLRAAAERYYRPQDLQIEEINSDGSNLAVYIRSLSTREKDSFDEWTASSFGFRIRASLSGGHYSLRLKTNKGDREYNVADLGFGYSQILPVITQIWSSTRSKRTAFSNYPIIYAIEQPELHLHPAYQAKVADLMIKAYKVARSNDLDVRFIIETHSDAIVNRIGRRISEEEINSDDVNIVLFDKMDTDTETKCVFSHYSSDGYLENWPYGFFDSEDF